MSFVQVVVQSSHGVRYCFASTPVHTGVIFAHAGQLHRFLARLTEATHGLKGRTVLYLAQNNITLEAAADKVSQLAYQACNVTGTICCRVQTILLPDPVASVASGSGPAPGNPHYSMDAADQTGHQPAGLYNTPTCLTMPF